MGNCGELRRMVPHDEEQNGGVLSGDAWWR